MKNKIAYSTEPDTTVMAERNKILAYMCDMDGMEKKIDECMMKTMEEMLQVMILCLRGVHVKKKGRECLMAGEMTSENEKGRNAEEEEPKSENEDKQNETEQAHGMAG
jgi:hypothetical protein